VSKIKTLVYSGGEIHDWKGCGDAIEEALAAAGQFDITRVNNDLDCLLNLDPYEAIVFYHTVTSITDAQLKGLLKAVEGGKGFVGIHSAADSFRECSGYRYFIGGYFVTHPAYRQYQVSVVDPTHPVTQGIDEFFATDEQYITGYDPGVNVLATALWRGKALPVIWTKSHGKGRICYIALGHNPESCRAEKFRELLVRGAVWAAQK